MAAGDRETVLSLLGRWGNIVAMQASSLERGDLDSLGRLVLDADTIKISLEEIFTSSRAILEDQDVADSLRDLCRRQNEVMEKIEYACRSLLDEMAGVARDRGSICSYRQRRKTGPCYLNKRT